MIKVSAFVFNAFQVNTFVVSDDSGECLIIDPANNSSKEDAILSKYITDNVLRPVMAVNTHGHIDHILGVDYVKKTYGIPFALHSADKFLVDSAPMHASIYGFKIDHSPSAEIALETMSEIRFGNTVLKVIETPGHTPGHVALYNEENKILFTGDTLFKESIGRTDLPGGDYSWIMKSILDKIVPLGGDVRFYPGHGASSTIGHELMYNPFVVEVIQGDVNYKL